ncbi:2-oxoglutarate and iron-dependent oxygenase domain-containing protein [soil metagenome]
MSNSIDVIDISPFIDGTDPASVAEAVGRANEHLGFLVVTGHGIGADAIDPVLAAAHEFFALPLAEKLACEPLQPWWFRGYQPMGISALGRLDGAEVPADLCELFRIGRFDTWDQARAAGYVEGREQSFAPNIWPSRPSALRPAMERYYREVERLAASLMSIFAVALDLDPRYFDAVLGDHISDLFVNHYPRQVVAPVEGQLRRGPHSDFGSLTVLYQDDAPGSLQVWNRRGEWEDVPHLPGTFVVNLGDLMARWTNDRWVSTRHRVVNPPPHLADTDRISMPFFHTPDYDAVVSCIPTCLAPGEVPRYEPITSGDWALRQNLRNVGA